MKHIWLTVCTCCTALNITVCTFCQAAADALRLERQVLVGEKAKLQKALDTLEQEHAHLQADLRRFQVSQEGKERVREKGENSY